ncbi:uncharacterized protein LOC111488374 isoform X2 [Cucurbita maxima]|nr:uncharacterized protein LOC111488374 isoform X2 [Cucurbita maxima]
MYCGTSSQNENEYLCTVRCGAALRDEEVLHTNGIDDDSARINGSNGIVTEANTQRGSNLNMNEDDWVEVKAPDGLALDHKNNSSIITSGGDSLRMIKQDFYEATAEITDANPCTSLTIRLLSLQNKSIVYVDEIYVFANPVDLEEESPVMNTAQSSQSSLMSMLVPTLLQLSKTTESSKSNGSRNSNEGIHILTKIGSNALDSTDSVTGLEQEGKSCVTVDDEVEFHEEKECDRSVRQPEVHLQVPVTERMHNEPLRRIENVLGQLVSRMDRIENCFLRFEENMLKPINSIEGRLKQVEQQLEVVTKTSHGSEWPSCYRMSAPSFSAIESASNSFYNSWNDHPSCGPDQKELRSGTSPIALDVSSSGGSSLMRPSLVVTAPEFSNVDDYDQGNVVIAAAEFSNGNDDSQENLTLEVVVDSSKSKPKPSIDDVLASALAQFALSSSSISIPEHSKTVTVRPPDLSNEDGNNHKKSLSCDLSETRIDHISCSQEMDNTQCTANSASPSLSSTNCRNSSPSRHDYSSKIADGDDKPVLMSRERKYESADGGLGAPLDEQSAKGMEELGNVEVIDETSEDYLSEKRIPIHTLHHHPKNDADRTNANADTKGSCDIDIVHDVLGFSRDTSIVNFEIPILDVSFTSIADSYSDNALKDLLGDMAESSYRASNPKERDDVTPNGEQRDLILVEEEGQENASSTNGPISVDMNYYTIMSDPVIGDGENLRDYCNNSVIWSLI